MNFILNFINQNFSSPLRISKWGFNAGVYLTICGFFSGLYTVAFGMIMIGSACALNLLFNKDQQKFAAAQDKSFLLFICIFLSVLVSFFASENMDLAFVRMRVNLGILLIPLIILGAPRFPQTSYFRWIYFCVIAALIAGFAVFINYLLDYELINKRLGQGIPIPTPVNHIRFSMAIAFSALISFYAAIRRYITGILIWVITTLLFVFNVFLAVRTGWMIIGVGFLMIIILNIKYIRFSNFSIIILVFASLFILAYYFLPSVFNRISYMIYDLGEPLHADSAYHSDSDRIYSLINGWQLFKSHPFFGIGGGDVNTEVEANALRNNFPIPALVPHNQFLYTAVAGGLVSLIIFCIGYFFPFFCRANWNSGILKAFLFLFGLTLQMEPTFETSVGVLMYSFIVSLSGSSSLSK